MIYITKEDLETDAQERLIDESTGYNDHFLNRHELKAISLCRTFLSRYDVEDIFDEEDPIHDEFLVDIICKIMLFRIFGRNAARKGNTSIKENYEWAIKQLEKIQTGKITLNLPPRVSDEDPILGPVQYGNFSNPDFYI